MEEREYLYALACAPELSAQAAGRLLALLGSAKAILESTSLPVPESQQLAVRSLANRLPELLRERDRWEKKGLRSTVLSDPAYPRRLARIPDPPLCLWHCGDLPDERPSAGVIGARRCSEYGRTMAERFSRELAEAGLQIISGMAMGIDGFAQRAALAAGGASFAVLGCGADRCYPASNRDLYRSLMEQGGVLSEYPPGTEPLAWHFPERNRIISGLSDVLLVIEAREKSGTLITVDQALEQGRLVMALPGRADDPLSRGCNELLRQGAELLLDSGDVLRTLGLRTAPKAWGGAKENPADRDLLALLSSEPKHPEQLAAESGQSFGELSVKLLRLEAAGLVRGTGGGMYVRC